MKNFIFLWLAIVLILPGCSSLTTLEDFVKENSFEISTAARYSTLKYIDRGETEAEKQERQNQVIERVAKVRAFINDNPRVTVSAVMDYLNVTIDWESLDLADKMIVQTILDNVAMKLNEHEEQANPLVNLTELLDTIVDAALIFGK